MNVVDSSGWLEYFAGGRNAEFFAAPLEDARRLVVPTICLLEVYRRVNQQRGRDAALQAVGLMRQVQVVALDERLALAAAELSAAERLPTADSIVLATARSVGALLWTQDADFEGRSGVRYVAARKR